MGYYKTAQICKKGHVVTPNINYKPPLQHCPHCGSVTYTECPFCGASIRGAFVRQGVSTDYTAYKPDFYCCECGKAFPWTIYFLERTDSILALDADLSLEYKDLIRNAIPDLVTESPTVFAAAADYSVGIEKASDIVKSALNNLLITIACESAKTFLFG